MLKTLLVASALAFSTVTLAETSHTSGTHHAQNVSPEAERAVGSHLAPRFRALIIQEMLAVTDASKRILEALARGQDDIVAKNAQDIHDSFVLAQEMTEEDSKALHDALPHSFVERDQEFHKLSGSLAEAARSRDTAKQMTLFTQMLNACIACHTEHATDRFPSLAEKSR